MNMRYAKRIEKTWQILDWKTGNVEEVKMARKAIQDLLSRCRSENKNIIEITQVGDEYLLDFIGTKEEMEQVGVCTSCMGARIKNDNICPDCQGSGNTQEKSICT